MPDDPLMTRRNLLEAAGAVGGLALAEGEWACELFMNKLDDTTKIVLNP